MLFEEYAYFNHKFPEPQYLGAKHTHLSWIKKLQNINNPIIQRLVSETSSFIVKIQVICGSIAVIIPILLSMDIFGLYWASILQNIEVAVLAIVGFSLFTTKKPELQ